MWRPSSLQARGSAAAQSGATDPLAAVHASASIEIPAPPKVVWDVLADVASWPGFLPGVSRTRITATGSSHGARLEHGSHFRWVNGGLPLRSRVERATPGSELTWTGVALWLVAVHRNTIEPTSPGSCRLTSAESMAGVGAAQLMPAAKLEVALADFVHAIAAEAARRTSRVN